MLGRTLLPLLLAGGVICVPRPQGRGRDYLDMTEITTPEPQGTKKGYAVPKPSPPPTPPLPPLPPSPPPCPAYTGPLASAIVRPPVGEGVHDKGYETPACPPPPQEQLPLKSTTTTTTTTPPPCPTAPPCPCCPIALPAPPCPQRAPPATPAPHKKGYQPPAAAPQPPAAAPQLPAAAPPASRPPSPLAPASLVQSNQPPGLSQTSSLGDESPGRGLSSQALSALTKHRAGGFSYYSRFQSSGARGDPAMSANYRQDQLATQYSGSRSPRPKSGYQRDQAVGSMGLTHSTREQSFQRDLEAYQQSGQENIHLKKSQARSNQQTAERNHQGPTNGAVHNPEGIPYFNDQPSKIKQTSGGLSESRISSSGAREDGGNSGNYKLTYLGSLVRTSNSTATLVRDQNIISSLRSNGNIVSSQGLIQRTSGYASRSGSSYSSGHATSSGTGSGGSSSRNSSGFGGSLSRSSSGSGGSSSRSSSGSGGSLSRSSSGYGGSSSRSSSGSRAKYSFDSDNSGATYTFDSGNSAGSSGSEANFEYRYPKYTRHGIVEDKITNIPGENSLDGKTYNAPAKK